MVTNTTIAMLTDFGTRDGYVGAMKGILRACCPAAALIDISHDIAPQDVAGAATALARCYRYFPVATVFLVVVDPGVGTVRRALAVAAGGYRFVAPDNGVLTAVFRLEKRWQAVALTDRRYWREARSDTFHGRDIFAPVAAHWAHGVDISALGDEVTNPILLPMAIAVWDAETASFRGEVRDVDRFGNLLTNIGPFARAGDALEWQGGAGEQLTLSVERACVQVAGQQLRGIQRTYGEVARGETLALIDSSGYLEIAIREGEAAVVLGMERGAAVALWVGE